MASDLKRGDHVEWNSEAGRVRGTIQKKVTTEITFKGYRRHASKEEPQYIIKSDKTDHLAIHKGSALKKVKKQKGEEAVGKKEEPVYYTARHLLQALSSLDDGLLDLPLMLVHGKELNKPNLVRGIIPSPVPVERRVVEEKKPSLLALADLR